MTLPKWRTATATTGTGKSTQSVREGDRRAMMMTARIMVTSVWPVYMMPGPRTMRQLLGSVGGRRHELARAIADVELRLHQKKAIEKAAAEVEFDIARNADEHPARGERHQAFQQHANNQDETVDAQS